MIKNFDKFNEGHSTDVEHIKNLFKDKNYLSCGFTKASLKNGKLVITHAGNMGNSVKTSVDPNLERLGLFSVAKLKKILAVELEDGSPDYMYSLVLKMPTVNEVFQGSEGSEEDLSVSPVKKVSDYCHELLGADLITVQSQRKKLDGALLKFDSACKALHDVLSELNDADFLPDADEADGIIDLLK